MVAVEPIDIAEMGAAPAALGLSGVSHRYGRTLAVVGVSLVVRTGEIVCLVGPSGCGKSTLLRLAAGLEDLQEGEIRIGSQVVADRHRSIPPEKRGVGLVFQDHALFPHLNVIDNVKFGLPMRLGDNARHRAMETLAQVGMEAFADAFPHTLSGGQQQRVALARALAPSPRIMLLDEPFSSLDTKLRNQVRDETLHVLKHSGTATLIVTHDPEEAMFLADRIALMRAGRIVQIGTPVDLYCRPVDAFAATFFGEVNRLASRVQGGVAQTPLGPVKAPSFPDGADVEVLIRPEGLVLGPSTDGGVHATVEAARLLGRTSLIHLTVPMMDGTQRSIHMHSRMPGQVLPDEDSTVAIHLDHRQAFVFPRNDAE